MRQLFFSTAHKAIYEDDHVYAYFAYHDENGNEVDHLDRKIVDTDGSEFQEHLEKKIKQIIARGLLNTQYFVRDKAAMMDGSSFPALLIQRNDGTDIEASDVTALKTLLPAIVLRHNAPRNQLFSPSPIAPQMQPPAEQRVLRNRRNGTHGNS